MPDTDDSIWTSREAAFGFVCTRCSTCCKNKRIQVSPYEIARLARRLGISTTQFAARWTLDGAGTTLSQTDTGDCVFLGGSGCKVHEDRPLVCRLYPLGRHIAEDGSERFSLVPEQMRPVGAITQDGTIADYLDAQGAARFMRAADDYFFWLSAAFRRLTQGGDRVSADTGIPRENAERLLDMDRAISLHEQETHTAAPSEVEARRELHIRILYGWLDATKQETTHVQVQR